MFTWLAIFASLGLVVWPLVEVELMSEARSNLVESTLRNRAGQEGLFCRLQGMCCVFSFLSIIPFYSVIFCLSIVGIWDVI